MGKDYSPKLPRPSMRAFVDSAHVLTAPPRFLANWPTDQRINSSGLSGRADRPRSVAGMGLPVSAFNTRSGTPSLREAKPDPVFRPRTSRDARPYREATRQEGQGQGKDEESWLVDLLASWPEKRQTHHGTGVAARAQTNPPIPVLPSTQHSVICTPYSLPCTPRFPTATR